MRPSPKEANQLIDSLRTVPAFVELVEQLRDEASTLLLDAIQKCRTMPPDDLRGLLMKVEAKLAIIQKFEQARTAVESVKALTPPRGGTISARQ